MQQHVQEIGIYHHNIHNMLNNLFTFIFINTFTISLSSSATPRYVFDPVKSDMIINIQKGLNHWSEQTHLTVFTVPPLLHPLPCWKMDSVTEVTSSNRALMGGKWSVSLAKICTIWNSRTSHQTLAVFTCTQETRLLEGNHRMYLHALQKPDYCEACVYIQLLGTRYLPYPCPDFWNTDSSVLLMCDAAACRVFIFPFIIIAFG